MARLSLHMSKYHIVGNHMSWLKCVRDFSSYYSVVPGKPIFKKNDVHCSCNKLIMLFVENLNICSIDMCCLKTGSPIIYIL